MRIDELHKFSDGTLNDVRSALDDILKRIRMEYLPQTVWINVDIEKARAIIQAINRQLKNRRLMKSLKKFVGGRLDYTHFYRLSHSELVDIEKKDSILQDGNPVKEILLKLNLPDHRILKDGGEDAYLSEVFLEVVPLSLGRGVTVYILSPPNLAHTRLGGVAIAVDDDDGTEI
ncbi:hypothetical protein Tco_0937471 [Tanacetum coccineum]|uniref:Uncharacterized protein n=1 Tax=Tanacetum coccineum TaxID=301880 RepID=A0ABQ5DH57_9ASTR